MESGASKCAKNEDGQILNNGKVVECEVEVMLPYYRSGPPLLLLTLLCRARYHIYSSKRHIRPLRTILFGGLGLRVLGVVRVWGSVSNGLGSGWG